MKKAQWENWLSLVLGVWFFILPWTASSSLLTTAASWNAWVAGAGIVVSAIFALRELKPWEEWVNIALGVWVMISPWTFDYAKDATLLWNSLVVGIGVSVLSALALQIARKAKA